MLVQIYNIYDTGPKVWRFPLFHICHRDFMDSWVESVNNPKSEFYKHPGDYTLFHIGEYDDVTCKFNMFDAPIRLSCAIEVLKKLDVEPVQEVLQPLLNK